MRKLLQKLFNGTVRMQLIAMVFLSTLPALVLLIYTGVELRREAIDNANDSALRLVNAISHEQQLILENTRLLLKTLAGMPDVQTLNAVGCSRLFAVMLEKNPLYVNLFAVSPDGRVFASGLPFVPHNVSHRKYFRDVLQSGEFSTGEYVIEVSARKPVFHYASPVLDKEGKLSAVLVAALDMDQYGKALLLANTPAGSNVAVSDHRHMLLCRYPEHVESIGKPDIPGMIRKMNAENEEGTFLETGVDGARRLYGFTRLRLKANSPPYLFIRVGIPEDQALAGVKAVIIKHAALLCLGFFVTIASVMLLGPVMITRRLDRIMDVSRGLRRGDYSIRTGIVHSGGEIVKLAEAFDLMAEEIEKKELERAQAETALQQSEEKYRSLIETTRDLVFIVDRNGIYSYVNLQFETTTGYLIPELIGRPFTSIVAPEFREIALNHFRNGLKGKATVPYRLDLIHKNGKTIPMEFLVSTLYDTAGVPTGRYGIGRNISERIQAEQALREAEKEKAKWESQIRQVQKMEAIGMLASGIAHDFNNILASIMGYTELTLAKLDDERARKNLAQVLSGCDRAKDMVQQILTFSHQTEKARKPLNLKIIVKESLKFLRSSLPATIEIQQALGDAPLYVMADPTELHQVIMNLCTNAAHAMREKGGVLHVELSRRPIEKNREYLFPDARGGEYVKLTVSDTGQGIAPAIIDKIFDPFFTTKGLGEGTGLGLSVVYGIVKSHDGAVHVESEPGEGAVFTVYLPLVEEDHSSVPEISSLAPTGTELILFVDDEPSILMIYGKMLSSLGYQVESTTMGEEALEIFRSHPERFDLVITDMTMPNMTGAVLAEAMLAVRPDIPIILCTGFSEGMSEKRAREIGIRKFLMKPIRRSQLAVAVREVLEQT